ncbi:MAG TPA: IPT/TIG domain-containing protein [Solirubrobacteraceae bacterium]|nr:IPT/TIG domain-containing protein [Solirubrobacteraceae bacterium]
MAVVAMLVMALAGLAPASSLGATGPQVKKLKPVGGPPAGGTSVVISGARFTGATAVKFGTTNATSFTVNSSSTITAVSPAGTGTVDVTVTTPEGTSPNSEADEFIYGPHITAIAPNRGPAGGGTSVTITGSDLAAVTAVKFGSANATSVKVDSSSSITAVSPEGTGTVDVTAVDPEASSASTVGDQFSYVPAPTVTGVSPAGGPEAGGTEVAITGTNFAEVTAVHFGMTSVGFTVNSEGLITLLSPPGVGAVDVTVTAFGGTSLTSFADQFSYEPPPTVTAVSPETGSSAGGASVTITGTNLEGATAVHFGTASATDLVVNSANSITAVSPVGTAGATVDVTVTTLGGTSATSGGDRFRYLQDTPVVVRKVSPTSGALTGNTPVVIGGSAFVGATAVHFGSVSATSFAVTTQHQIKAVAPPGTGTVDVTVTTPEGVSPTSAADQFRYVPSPPVVEELKPTSGRPQGGTKVLINGTGLYGATEVHFGSVSAAFEVTPNGRQIVAFAPSAAVVDHGTVDITVTTPEGTSATSPADKFSYKIPPPVITHLSLKKGSPAGGEAVTITGEYFIEVSAVDFGSFAATEFTVNSPYSITAIAPPETVGLVKVGVTTAFGTSGHGVCEVFGEEGPELIPCPTFAERFKVLEPTITGIAPANGPSAGGTSVVVTGTGFAVGTTATAFSFDTTPAASVDCTSTTTCTVVAPEHAVGTVDVRATVVEAAVSQKMTKRTPADRFTFE